MLSKEQLQEAARLSEQARKHGYAAQTEAGACATNAWLEWLSLHGHQLLESAGLLLISNDSLDAENRKLVMALDTATRRAERAEAGHAAQVERGNEYGRDLNANVEAHAALEKACASAQLRANRLAIFLCPECEGEGMIRRMGYDAGGQTGEENVLCPRCKGKGLPGVKPIGWAGKAWWTK